jgi:hypothetical protein
VLDKTAIKQQVIESEVSKIEKSIQLQSESEKDIKEIKTEKDVCESHEINRVR